MNNTFKGFIIGIHNVEPRSYKNECSPLFDNLTVTPEFLEDFILSVQNKGFTFVSLQKFINDKQTDDNIHKNVVITIDDGWKGIYKYAFPIFKKHKIPFVFYVATDLIENGFKNCKLPEMDGMDILCNNIRKIESDTERQKIIFNNMWKHFKYKKRIFFWRNGHSIMQSLFKEKIDFTSYKNKNCCTYEELKEMAECDLCEIGSHTHNHIHMDRISRKNILKQLIESKKKIEENIGKECNSFSYPYGHYSEITNKEVQKYYKNALIVARKTDKNMFFTLSDDSIYTMPRKFIDMSCNIEKLLNSIKLKSAI